MDPLHTVVADEEREQLIWSTGLAEPKGWQRERCTSPTGDEHDRIRRIRPDVITPRPGRTQQTGLRPAAHTARRTRLLLPP